MLCELFCTEPLRERGILYLFLAEIESQHNEYEFETEIVEQIVEAVGRVTGEGEGDAAHCVTRSHGRVRKLFVELWSLDGLTLDKLMNGDLDRTPRVVPTRVAKRWEAFPKAIN